MVYGQGPAFPLTLHHRGGVEAPMVKVLAISVKCPLTPATVASASPLAEAAGLESLISFASKYRGLRSWYVQTQENTILESYAIIALI